LGTMLAGSATLTIVFAENQLQTTLDLEQIGATEFIGWTDEITTPDLALAIERLIENPAQLKSISERAKMVMREWQGTTAITVAMKKLIN